MYLIIIPKIKKFELKRGGNRAQQCLWEWQLYNNTKCYLPNMLQREISNNIEEEL